MTDDTLSVILTAKTLKLPETKKWLHQDELNIYLKRPTCHPNLKIWTL